MNITDYIHFYVGAKIKINGTDEIGTLTGTRSYDDPNDDVSTHVVFYKNADYFSKINLRSCKLLLIPMANLSQEDFRALDYSGTLTLDEFKEYYSSGLTGLSTSDTWCLIQKHYDVFGLIEAGCAIDGYTKYRAI